MKPKISPARIVAIVLGVLIIALALSFTANAQATSTIELKKGSKLTYNVTKNGKTHKLYITIIAMSPDIEVNWNTDEENPRTGHSKGDHTFETSREITPDFKSENDKVRAPFIWFNKGLYDELTIGKTIYTKEENPNKHLGLVNQGKEVVTVSIDNENVSVKVLHALCVSSGSDDEFWILDNGDNTLIIKAIISGESLELSQIKL